MGASFQSVETKAEAMKEKEKEYLKYIKEKEIY